MELPVRPPVVPMLARLARTLPAGPGWTYEPKWDGFRCLAFRCSDDSDDSDDSGDIDLRSRHGRPLAPYFPELVSALRELPEPHVVLDGELLVTRNGRYDFEALLARLHPAPSRVHRLATETPATYVAFDVLAVGGRDVRSEPLASRRVILEQLVGNAPSPVVITPVTHDVDVASRWLEGSAGVDGVVAKHVDVTYRPGERAVVKVKREHTADCVVAGFRQFPDGAAASLLLGVYDHGTLRHIGVVSQLAEDSRRTLAECLQPLVAPLAAHPWRHGFGMEGGSLARLKGAAGRWTPGMPMDWVPLRPETVCEVAYDHLDGLRFRNPARLRRWRPDRDPWSCTVEQFPAEQSPVGQVPVHGRRPGAVSGFGGHLDVGGRRIRVTSLERILWPEAGVTKAQLIDYYIAVAPVLLPHLADRPVTLHRYPDGVYGEHFFQSRCPPHPAWVHTVRLSYPSTGKSFEAAVVDDLPSLVWAANLSTIEFHPLLARTRSLDRPTAVVFDLDPGPPAGLIEAAEVALALRQILDGMGLVAMPKTSGISGIHVFVPVGEQHTFQDTKAFARSVARELVRREPGRVTDRSGRVERTGKVFVDWSQNDPGRSTVAPYSLRGMRLPAVSLPVTWDEVAAAVQHREHELLRFAPAEVVARMERHGDLFAQVLTVEQQLANGWTSEAAATPGSHADA